MWIALLALSIYVLWSKLRTVEPPANESCGSMCIHNGHGCVHLITSIYRPASTRRFDELLETIERNIKNAYIFRLHILRDDLVPFELVLEHIPAIYRGKLVDGGAVQRPEYHHYFSYSNSLVASGNVTDGMSLAIGHADIEFGSSPDLDWIFTSRPASVVWAISRKRSPRCTSALQGCMAGDTWYEECPQFRSEQCENYGGSHDMFVYSGGVSQSLLAVTHFQPNAWGAENLLISLLRTYELKTVENPCLDVGMYHVHCDRQKNSIEFAAEGIPVSARVNDAFNRGYRADWELQLADPAKYHRTACGKAKWSGPRWPNSGGPWSAVRWAQTHNQLTQLPWEDPDYSMSPGWKSVHNSETSGSCLLVANGPSLNKMNWDAIHKSTNFDVVLGMNKIFLGIPRFQLELTHFVAVNNLVIEQSVQQIVDLGPMVRKFLPYNSRKYFPVDVVNNSADHNIWWLGRPTDSWYSTQGVCKSSFCFDISRGANQGYTVTYVALQILHFLGCGSVSIVGMDHSFAQKGNGGEVQVLEGADPNHFDPNYFGGGQKWHLADLHESEHYYSIARQAYESTGRQLVDATSGGQCRVFDKARHEELFACMFDRVHLNRSCSHLIMRAPRDHKSNDLKLLW